MLVSTQIFSRTSVVVAKERSVVPNLGVIGSEDEQTNAEIFTHWLELLGFYGLCEFAKLKLNVKMY